MEKSNITSTSILYSEENFLARDFPPSCNRLRVSRKAVRQLNGRIYYEPFQFIQRQKRI
jgi:hypothetical protein